MRKDVKDGVLVHSNIIIICQDPASQRADGESLSGNCGGPNEIIVLWVWGMTATVWPWIILSNFQIDFLKNFEFFHPPRLHIYEWTSHSTDLENQPIFKLTQNIRRS
jgi:hypothetical protein